MTIDKMSSYFSATYIEAKTRFVNNAKDKGLDIESFVFPMPGVVGEELSIDLVEIGNKNSNNVQIIVSGTHGVEGFAGSACQLYLLDKLDDLTLSDTKIVLVHALNPFGFSFCRRVNENNIDINRNFINFNELDEFQKEYFEHNINTRLRNTSGLLRAMQLCGSLVLEILKGNKSEIQSVITKGQYVHCNDLFFGGTHESLSAKYWHDIINKYTDMNVYLLDIHTGLGKFSRGYIMSHTSSDNPEYDYNQKFFHDLNLVHTNNDTSISSRLNGTLSSSLSNPDNAIALEFGTYSGLRVLCSLASENYHWTNKNYNKTIKYNQKLKRYFIPNSIKWKESILKKFLIVFERQQDLINYKDSCGGI